MALTPATVARHELNGLPTRVVESIDVGRVGLSGRVRRETTRTLTLATDRGQITVPKAGTTFEFTLVDAPAMDGTATDHPDTDAGGSTPSAAVVEGDRLIARPARRTETGARPSWH